MTNELGLYDLPVPTTKEECVGRIWSCPSIGCGAKVKIKEDGVAHYHRQHWFKYDLEQLFALAQLNYKWEQKLWFNKDV
jgi:hypothetical protein